MVVLAFAGFAAAQGMPKTGGPRPAPSAEAGDAKEPLDHPNWLSPFVGTPARVVDAALELAGAGGSDVVYDLGSGDGRIILAAARRFQAKAVGIEWNQELCEKTSLAIQLLGLQGRVKVIQGDIFAQDVSPATVVTGYLMPKAWERLGPILERQLKKGTRVVSINDPIPGWPVVEMKRLGEEPEGFFWKLYLYRMR
jgi:SAM-dependent methyltransferase